MLFSDKLRFGLFSVLFGFPCVSMAQAKTVFDIFSKSPPPFCVAGKSSHLSFEVGVKCNGDVNGGNVSCNYSADGWANILFGSDYLRVELPKYLLNGVNTQVKGDGSVASKIEDSNRKVHYFDFAGGYRGEDEINHEGNSYKSYIIRGTSPDGLGLGPTKVWVMAWKEAKLVNPNGFLPFEDKVYAEKIFCSVQDVVVQQPPKIVSGKILPFPNNSGLQRIDITYQLDANSMAYRENSGAIITIYANGKQAAATTVYSRSGTVSLNPTGFVVSNGPVTFKAVIDDRNYRHELTIGSWQWVPAPPLVSTSTKKYGITEESCHRTYGSRVIRWTATSTIGLGTCFLSDSTTTNSSVATTSSSSVPSSPTSACQRICNGHSECMAKTAECR